MQGYRQWLGGLPADVANLAADLIYAWLNPRIRLD